MILSSILLAFFAFDSAYGDQELKDRFVAASEEMGKGMMALVKSCAPGVDLSGVDGEYTPQMVDAAHCVVDTHIQRFGRAETETLVAEAEAMAERSFSSFQEMNALQQDYPLLSGQALLEINRSCGTFDASRDFPLNRVMRQSMASMADCLSQ
jgi:hypothetical protein